MSEFGNYLSELRKKRELSLRTVARDLKISASYLSDLETGNRLAPNNDAKFKNLLQDIIKYYGLNKDEEEKLIRFSDMNLIEHGIVSNELKNYINDVPNACVALRMARDINLSNEEWEDIINKMKNK